MMKVKLFFITFLLCQMTLANDFETIQANNPLIEYTGRIDFADPLAPTFSYSGVSVRACFQGTCIALILNDAGTQNYYNVILDNKVISRLQTQSGNATYNVASGLKDTIHEIEIFKLTEEMFGKTRFIGYEIDKGKTLVEIGDKRDKLIEFIGNSITCGYGNEGVNGGTFGPTTENHYLTYAAITSRSFNARHLAVCKSGIGVYRNYDGPVNGNDDCMSNFYQRIFLYDTSPLYQFSQKPDLICIDLGTNDFSTGNGDSARFVNKYLQFIDTIQSKNDGADILCLLGPMMSGSDLIKVRRYLNYIVTTANAKGNGNVYFFEMSAQTGDLGIAIDYHPTVAQHLRNAKELTCYISSLKNWKASPIAYLGKAKVADEIILNFNTGLNDPSGKFSGFSVLCDQLPVKVDSVSLSSKDKSEAHLYLAEELQVGKAIEVSYTPGTIEAEGGLMLNGFSSFPVQNELSETTFTGGTIDVNGSKVTLSFNKKLLASSNLDGIMLFDEGMNVLETASFTCYSSKIEIILKKKVVAGSKVYVSILSSVFGADKVAVKKVDSILLTNKSTFTSVIDNSAADFIVYPNPSIDMTINYRVPGTISEKVKARLFDLQGKVVYNKELSQTSGTIDFNFSGIRQGSYILKMTVLGKEYSKLICF